MYKRRQEMESEQRSGARMRQPVQSVYNRQVAKCLDDINEVMEIPVVVIDRIKKAIEFTCKDVDKLRTRNPNGVQHEQEDETRGNR